ncbi:DUF397 domain-containing protein [Streptomyces sp. NPDC001793]|uniref:DUF397 domain-containing protein n=1 Tax=Streptomyces sp. NPDC001793 TaxID=3154657 RepID=UPI0033258BFA
MIPDLDLAVATWVKSSYSDGSGGDCLEFCPAQARTHGVVPIRDSKAPDGPPIIMSVNGWSSFISAVKNGEFAV